MPERNWLLNLDDDSVALRYKSTNGNGPLGVGWELELGDIERRTKGASTSLAASFVMRTSGSTADWVSIGGTEYRLQSEGGLQRFRKPISENDLARFLADCLEDPVKRNAILPIGGPGAPISPLQQAAMLFELAGTKPRLRRVPVRVLDIVIRGLDALGRAFPALRDKAELARIGRYYATESMLVLGADGRYDAGATPAYGDDALQDFYRRVWTEGLAGQELGEQAVFAKARKRGPTAV